MEFIVPRGAKRVKLNVILAGFWGAFLYALFFGAALLDQTVFSYMGVGSQKAVALIQKYFWLDILLAQGKILLWYLLVGCLSGSIIYLFWTLAAGKRFISLRLRYRTMILTFSLVLWESFFLFWSMVKYPAVYNEFFYARSPVRQELQTFITTYLDPNYFLLAGLLFIGIFVFFLFKRISFFSRVLLVSFLSSLIIVLFLKRSSPCTIKGHNIIIFAADSLRNDYISPELTPHIWNLAQEGIRFKKCYVSLPRTFPQWITYLKSQYPHTHEVRNMFPDKNVRRHEEGALPQVLKERGYATAVVSDFAGDVFSRFSAGFETVSAPYFNFKILIKQRCLEMHYLLLPFLLNSYGSTIFPELKEMANWADPFLLEKQAEKIITENHTKSLFLVFFSSITHFPYAPPYPYYKFATDDTYSGSYKYLKPNIPGENIELADHEVQQIRGLYKGSVKAFDDTVERFMKFLHKKGLDKNTTIVILADHGEQLYEYGRGQGHGEHLRGDAVLNVPFILKSPFHTFAKHTIDEPVRDIDVSPTLLSLLEIIPPESMQGINVLPLAQGTTVACNLDIVAETGLWFTDKGDNFYQKQRMMYPDIIGLGTIDKSYHDEVVIKPELINLTTIAKHRMVRTKDYKLIYIPKRESIEYELYDLAADPEELHNIAAQRPEIVALLKKRLFSWMSQDKSSFWRNEYLIPYP